MQVLLLYFFLVEYNFIHYIKGKENHTTIIPSTHSSPKGFIGLMFIDPRRTRNDDGNNSSCRKHCNKDKNPSHLIVCTNSQNHATLKTYLTTTTTTSATNIVTKIRTHETLLYCQVAKTT